MNPSDSKSHALAPLSEVHQGIDDPTHPFQIACRTYFLGIFLSTSPAVFRYAPSILFNPERRVPHARALLKAILRELHPVSFAFAMTTAATGGALLKQIFQSLERILSKLDHQTSDATGIVKKPIVPYCTGLADYILSAYFKFSSFRKAFLANFFMSTFAFALLQKTGQTKTRSSRIASPTLDLTLLCLVRGLDAAVQSRLHSFSNTKAPFREGLDTGVNEKPMKEWHRRIVAHIDAFVFWASSARIMWCFFYEPQRLPLSYRKWINSLANADQRLLDVLRALRNGQWSYKHGSPDQAHLLTSLSRELGHPPIWGDPHALPAYGGSEASAIWSSIAYPGRKGVGGLPCEIVHGGIPGRWGLSDGCLSNALARGAQAFIQALVLYLPVHFLPSLSTRPSSLMRLGNVVRTFLAACRSATFLSAFLSSYWFTICCVRTLVLGRLMPWISHDFWDGQYGCVFGGSVVCGASIWIESARRRGEMALYVLPRALRATLPVNRMTGRSLAYRGLESLTFGLSLAYLLTVATQQPEALRGLSKWTLAYVMNGPNVRIWKKSEPRYHPTDIPHKIQMKDSSPAP